MHTCLTTHRPPPPGRPRSRGRWRARTLLVGAAAVLALLATPALAHTELVSSSPVDGASVKGELGTVVLEFSREVQLLGDTLTISGPEGEYVGEVAATRSTDGLLVTTTLDPALSAGSWVLDWQILASDSHPRRGTVLLEVGDAAAAPSARASEVPPSATPRPQAELRPRSAAAAAPKVPTGTPAPAAARRPLELLGALARIVMYLGLMSAAGLALFKAGPHRGEHDRAPQLALIAGRLALVALLASLLEVLLHVAAVSGRGFSGALDGPTWRAVLRTGLGSALGVRSVGLLLLGIGGIRRARAAVASGPDGLKLLGAALAIGSFQLVGHTASTAPEAVVRTADLVHATAAAVWVGGLLGLFLLSRGQDATGRARAAARFSTIAIVAVIGVAVAGSALALVTLPGTASVFGTAYGRVLVAKLAVVAVLGAVGAHSHRSVVPLVGSDDPVTATHGLHRLHRNVVAESVLMVVVLSLTAVLVALSPS